jgi:hypothetical protein
MVGNAELRGHGDYLRELVPANHVLHHHCRRSRRPVACLALGRASGYAIFEKPLSR